MKEKIVLDFGAEIKNICRGCAEGVKSKCPQTEEKIKECILYTSRFDEYRVEQVPETWEELKELCKGITVDVKVCKDGTVYCYEHCIAKNRTPAQMWGIIKNLRGE